MKRLLTLTALGTILAVSSANAAGFHLREQSSAAQGNAYAGATAGAENISYAYFNAAGITRQEGTNFNFGGTYIIPKAKMKNVQDGSGAAHADSHNIVHAAIAPNMAVSHQINEKAYVAVALNVPYGMTTKYDAGWAGNGHGVTSKIMTVLVTPMAAYKVTDKLSLGAGLQIQYFKAKLSQGFVKNNKTTSTVEGDAVDLGWQIGSMYEFNDQTRLGLAYRSRIQHKIKGDLTTPNPVANGDIYAHLTTPAMLSMGIYHDINEKWSVMAEYQRVFWSSFRDLYINYKDGKPVSATREKWRDTNFYAVGASYQIDHQWKWRLGLAYDQAAARLQQRTPRIPDSDRFWYSTGLNYQYNDKLSFDFAYTYIYAHKAHLDTKRTGNRGPSTSYPAQDVTADYQNSIQLVGISLNYKF